MTDKPAPLPEEGEPADLEIALQVDSVCDAFELSWKGGERPDLETYLKTTAMPLPTLFVELVLIDMTYRQKAGEFPTLEEYADRFPHLGHALEDVTVPASQSLQNSSDISLAVSKFPRLDKFELKETLGEGAFGTVWKAWDTHLRRWVALKQFRESDSLLAHKLLLREARAVALIDHPHVVRVHEIGVQQGQDYVAFEYLPGGTLDQWMKRHRTADGRSLVTPEQAVDIALQLAKGLQAVHERNVIHRDFKPGNVLRDEQGRLKIADFGLARHGTTLSTIGGDGVLMGTVPYMSPEQCRGVSNLAAGSDLYSLGVILYELLTGQRPLTGSRMELLKKIQNDTPLPPSQLAEIPPALENICLRALEKDPRDRYPSAAAMRADLEAFQQGKWISRRRPSLLVRAARKIQAHRWTAVVLTGIALLVPLFAASQGGMDDGKKIIHFTTTPPGARIALIPLDPLTHRPLPEKIIHARQRTPIREKLALPGDYLIEAYLDDGRFHEVYRRVPDDRENVCGPTAYFGWRRDKDDFNSIKLVDITIPDKNVTDEMAFVPGNEHFFAGTESSLLTPRHERAVPAFYMDTTEVPVSVNVTLFDRTREPDLRWKKPPTMEHAYTTTWPMAVWVAELLGKRLPDEFEYELAATNGGTQEFNGPTPEEAVPDNFLPVGQPAFDHVNFNRPVFGLRTNVAEWTMTAFKAAYPPFDARRDRQLSSLSELEFRSVRGGDHVIVQGQNNDDKIHRNPRDRHRVYHYTNAPGLGFRGVRSLRPRLTPEDFGRPISTATSIPTGETLRRQKQGRQE